jgi:hypothetical protein
MPDDIQTPDLTEPQTDSMAPSDPASQPDSEPPAKVTKSAAPAPMAPSSTDPEDEGEDDGRETKAPTTIGDFIKQLSKTAQAQAYSDIQSIVGQKLPFETALYLVAMAIDSAVKAQDA